MRVYCIPFSTIIRNKCSVRKRGCFLLPIQITRKKLLTVISLLLGDASYHEALKVKTPEVLSDKRETDFNTQTDKTDNE